MKTKLIPILMYVVAIVLYTVSLVVVIMGAERTIAIIFMLAGSVILALATIILFAVNRQ